MITQNQFTIDFEKEQRKAESQGKSWLDWINSRDVDYADEQEEDENPYGSDFDGGWGGDSEDDTF